MVKISTNIHIKFVFIYRSQIGSNAPKVIECDTINIADMFICKAQTINKFCSLLSFNLFSAGPIGELRLFVDFACLTSFEKKKNLLKLLTVSSWYFRASLKMIKYK